jgi:hypothetical protein
VLAHSINVRASQPVSITPLMLSQLGGIHTRSVIRCKPRISPSAAS